jgi:hypothetical protein
MVTVFVKVSGVNALSTEDTTSLHNPVEDVLVA